MPATGGPRLCAGPRRSPLVRRRRLCRPGLVCPPLTCACLCPLATAGVVGTANGSCFARIGRTAVVTGIKCEVGTPAEATPLQGVLGACTPPPLSRSVQ